MDINTWLTVVTIFIAILTVLPREERMLLQLKLFKAEYVSFFIVLIAVIPFLILFPSIAERWPFFWRFTISNGFKPSIIAFGLFYILFLWIITRMIFIRPKGRTNKRITAFFKNALLELPFPQFFSLFTKYSKPELLNKYWEQYKEIVLQPEFLNGLTKYRPNYVNSLWGLLEDEREFKLVFVPFLSDIQSAYYSEIKQNDGISTVSGDNSFLQSVIVTHLLRNRKNELLYIISDLSKKLVRSERGKQESIYLQPHPHVHTQGEEGYDLPLYYHIRFISLMYDTAITNKVDTYPHMHTLFNGIIDEIVINLPVIEGPIIGENPTNYHWLISEMFYAMNTWLIDFGGEQPINDYEKGTTNLDHAYFDPHSSYVDFIPSIMNFSCKALYTGLEECKLNVEFVAQKIYYCILSEYFSHSLHPAMKESIEDNVIRNFPKEYVDKIIDFALDEAFANSFESFKSKRFSGSKFDIQEQQRLWNALNKYRLV